jgi:Domain of unknown function DUF1828
MIAAPCEAIAAQIGNLYDCTPLNGYIKIRTPYLYPDGDVIDLFVRQDNSAIMLTDLGSTLQWLGTQTPTEKRTQRQRRIIQDVCLNHATEFAEGALIVRIKKETDLAWAVTRSTQSALRVADISFSLRTQLYSSAADEVAEFLARAPRSVRGKHPPYRTLRRNMDRGFPNRRPQETLSRVCAEYG